MCLQQTDRSCCDSWIEASLSCGGLFGPRQFILVRTRSLHLSLKMSPSCVVGLLVALFYISHQNTASAALGFVPLDTYSSVDQNDFYGSSVNPPVTFHFGTTNVSSIYVSVIGHFSMDYTYSDPRVAPFAAFYGYGSVHSTYVRYSESFTNSQLNDVSEHIRSETGTSFNGTWMLVAEWNKVTEFSDDTSNTFQGILITDGSSSYAVFIYNCSNMEWGGSVINWYQSETHYAVYYASGLSNSNRAVCGYQTTIFTTLVYRIDKTTLSFVRFNSFFSVPRGDKTSGSSVVPDVIFRFGTIKINSIYVNKNGFFSIGFRYTSLSAFPSYNDNSFVAPFAADIETSSTGSVHYSECFTISQLNVVSEHIRTKTGSSFHGTWMLVAEWNGVPLLNESPTITNTFQGILISDGFSAYAVFIYNCSNMEWGYGMIGWRQSSTQSAFTDDHYDTNGGICGNQTSSFVTLVFRLNSDVCLLSEFECDNGRCICSSQKCDGKDDCGDNSDEEGCGHRPLFICDSGECVGDRFRCDGSNNCGDNSDEDGCDTVNVGLAVGLSLGLIFLLILVGAVIAVGIVYAVKTGRLTIAAKGRQ